MYSEIGKLQGCPLAGVNTIQISQQSVEVFSPQESAVRQEFDESGCALLPGFLSPQITKHLLKLVNEDSFQTKDEVFTGDGKIFGTTLKLPESDPLLMSLHFILNRAELFATIERLTACPRLANFTCRVHRTIAGAGQSIDWHDDAVQDRKVGLNISLSEDEHDGGAFQIRDPQRRIRREVGCMPPGDGFLFRIGSGWQHRLTQVTRGQRTVAVGWFRTRPSWHAIVSAGLNSLVLRGDL